ncbi:hypothetical protein EON65_57075, partial [archaeon]
MVTLMATIFSGRMFVTTTISLCTVTVIYTNQRSSLVVEHNDGGAIRLEKAVDASRTSLATTEYRIANLQRSFKIVASVLLSPHSVLIWTGSNLDISEGFTVCNGDNASPNLIVSFLVGAGGKYDVISKGGEATTTLQTKHLAKHTHADGGYNRLGIV